MKFLFVLLFFLAPVAIHADTTYTSLAPISDYVGETEKIDENSFSKYLNNMFKLGIALCTGLAVLMLIIGGIQYVSSDAWSKKNEGKERVYAALFGLLIALGSYALLRTLSPDLLDTRLQLEEINLEKIATEVYLTRVAELTETLKQATTTGLVGDIENLNIPFVPSKNAKPGQKKTAIVLHVTEGGYVGAKDTLSGSDPDRPHVSAHFLVGRNEGQVVQLVKVTDDATHTRSNYPTALGKQLRDQNPGKTANQYTIGIEVVAGYGSIGMNDFTPWQYAAVTKIVRSLSKDVNPDTDIVLSPQSIVTHLDTDNKENPYAMRDAILRSL